MNCKNPHFNVNQLALYAAILVLLGDFITVLIAYQLYYEDLLKKGNNDQALLEQQDRQIRVLPFLT